MDGIVFRTVLFSQELKRISAINRVSSSFTEAANHFYVSRHSSRMITFLIGLKPLLFLFTEMQLEFRNPVSSTDS